MKPAVTSQFAVKYIGMRQIYREYIHDQNDVASYPTLSLFRSSVIGKESCNEKRSRIVMHRVSTIENPTKNLLVKKNKRETVLSTMLIRIRNGRQSSSYEQLSTPVLTILTCWRELSTHWVCRRLEQKVCFMNCLVDT